MRKSVIYVFTLINYWSFGSFASTSKDINSDNWANLSSSAILLRSEVNRIDDKVNVDCFLLGKIYGSAAQLAMSVEIQNLYTYSHLLQDYSRYKGCNS